jgi:hypothetical protein
VIGSTVTSALIAAGSAFVLTVAVLMFFYFYYGERLEPGESLVVFAACLGFAGLGVHLWRRLSSRGWCIVAIIVVMIVLLAIMLYPSLR